jgi:RHS repeat-associated protein
MYDERGIPTMLSAVCAVEVCFAASRYTGKERDSESGNDYFGARYYASSMGRFLSPDPLYFKASRLKDPQALNLYEYSRNNPLIYLDPTGLAEVLNCNGYSGNTCNSDIKNTLSDLNGRQGKQFDIGRDSNTGLLTTDYTGKLSDLSAGERALYDAITDKSSTGYLFTERSDDNVQFGGFNGRGANLLDRSDLDLLGKASPSAAGDTVSHELLESWKSSTLSGINWDDRVASNGAYTTSHAYATKYFGEGVTGERHLLNGGPSFTQDWTFPAVKQTVTVTTAPRDSHADINQDGFIPGKITNVQPK